MAGKNFLFNYKSLLEWAYHTSRFNQLGLMRHDLLHKTPDVEEALRRLPKEIQDERNFRIIRAMQLEGQKKILPKEQWTKLEEDVLYLKPYLDEVRKEQKEKWDWDNQ